MTARCENCGDPMSGRVYKGRRFCNLRCYGAVLRTTPEEKLAKFVQRGEPDACWEWMGGRKSDGYGRFKESGRTVMAHRAAYVILGGYLIPDGALLRHTCDNPPCCNPAHLVPGTAKDNTNDALERDRLPRGERHPSAILSAAQVADMRDKRAAGALIRELAEEFGCSTSNVSSICTGRHWRRHQEVAR